MLLSSSHIDLGSSSMDNLIPGTPRSLSLKVAGILIHTKFLIQESRKQNVMLYEQTRILMNRPNMYDLTWRLAHVFSRVFITRSMSIADSLFRAVTYVENLHAVFYCKKSFNIIFNDRYFHFFPFSTLFSRTCVHTYI